MLLDAIATEVTFSEEDVWQQNVPLCKQYYTIIDFWWGLLMTMKAASGIGWPTPQAEVNHYLTMSSWWWVDRNQKSIIVLLNYQEFPSQKLITSDAITAFLSHPLW